MDIIKEQGQIISEKLKQLLKVRFYVSWYYIYINDNSCESNKIMNKDVLWFFIKSVLQKITKTHDNVCCAFNPKYNLLQENNNVD